MQNPILFLDNSSVLPASIFAKRPDRAWCTFFIQDAKLTSETMKTCEFGLGMASQWQEMGNHAFNQVMEVLNSKVPRIWIMASKKTIAEHGKQFGNQSSWVKVQRAVARDKKNILSLEDPRNKRNFPTSYDDKAPFDPHQLSHYYAVGITPYIDLPPEHFADITGKHPKDPRVLLLDEGPAESLPLIFNYKHMTRLTMNGTESAPQNPPYVIIETKFSPELASFLKQKFPHDERLVLKPIGSRPEEGVRVLDASSEETLTKDLYLFLADQSEFRNKNPFSICIIESFISAPENPSLQKIKETIVRVGYIALQDNKETQVYAATAVRTFEKTPTQPNLHTRGIVNLANFNDGRFESLSHEKLKEIGKRYFKEISAFTKRAISYEKEAAVEYFLKSENQILNLIGIEFFSPHFTFKYSEKVLSKKGMPYNRISQLQCILLISLIRKNQNSIVREKILENILIPEIEAMFKIPFYEASEGLESLFEIVVQLSQEEKCLTLCRQALINNLKSLYFGLSPCHSTSSFQKKGLNLLESFNIDLMKDFRLYCWRLILLIHPDCAIKNERVDYFNAISKIQLKTISKETLQTLKQKFKNGFILFRALLRFQLEEKEFETPWSQNDWDKLLKDLESFMFAPALSTLPEVIHLGWKAEQLIALFNNYNKNPNAQEFFPFFAGLMRALSHHRNTDSQVTFNFMQKIAISKMSLETLVFLTHDILEKTLMNGKNLNEVLKQKIEVFQ